MVPAFRLCTFGIVFSLSAPLFSQDCNYSKIDTRIIPKFDRTFFWDMNGAAFNDLSTDAQGVCAVEIYFEHHFLSDLQISLRSPAGQTVQLVRDDLPNDTTYCSRWKIKFVSCGQPASPDTGFKHNFDDNTWPNGENFSGTYYPATGCLEDFNRGSVNGKWELKVSSQGYSGMGFLYGFKVDFWQNQGIYCDGLYAETTANTDVKNSAVLLPDLNSFLGNNSSKSHAEDSDMPFREKVADFGRTFVGSKYKYAGRNPQTGFDCSGFTSFVLKNFGVDVLPSSKLQTTAGHYIPIEWVLPGDLLFFGESWHNISHVALVVKHDSEGVICVHSTSSQGVKIDNVTQSSYWRPLFQFARDVITGD